MPKPFSAADLRSGNTKALAGRWRRFDIGSAQGERRFRLDLLLSSFATESPRCRTAAELGTMATTLEERKPQCRS
jgi:hypothetical protein